VSQSATLSDSDLLRRDRRVISLIGVSHGASHFYQLALPPLFTLINIAEGYSFVELATLTLAFYIASAICQPFSGFLVDRFGARRVLLAGLGMLAAATTLIGAMPFYPAMFLLSIVAGIGNSVFHPCDYSIMNATISESRMARAFSFHMFGGYAGYVLAPVSMIFLGNLIGWQSAIIVAGAVGLVLFAILWSGSRDFRDSTHERAESGEVQEPLKQSLKALTRAPVIMCWVFFFFVAMGQMGLMTFVPTLMHEIYAFDLQAAGAFVSVMIGAVMVGVLCGGYLGDVFHKPDVVVTTGYIIGAFLVACIWHFELTTWQLYVIFAVVGFLYGVVFPSRELLIRAATPKGASGRVFGFVYSGMDFGAALIPVLFGWFVDTGIPRTAFLCVAILWLLSVVVMLMTNAATKKQALAAAE
jgi:FSR family fosmidomycin resistance protein-like MFS transporter